MKELDVLLLAKYDYSNVSYLYAKAMRTAGIKAEAWAVKPSPRHYSRHANLFKSINDDILPLARQARAIQFMHSRRFNAIDVRGKFITVFHGGSRYRHAAERMNAIFNPIVNKSIIQTGDLFNRDAKNGVWVLPPIETDLIEPRFEMLKSRLVVAHYPHKTYVKGTETICQAIESLRNSNWLFNFSDSLVSWEENLDRIGSCDIYIEAVQPELREETYGEWGVTALEAAALGKIVITHFRSYERYLREYGACPLIVANNGKQLYAKLKRLLQMSRYEIMYLKKATREWVERNHSLKAVGQRMKNEVYGEIL